MKKIIYKWIDQHFLGGCTNYNSLEVRKSCRSKNQARDVFAANDIPHAKGALFSNPWVAYSFARKQGFPLVIKPNVSGFSRGSHFPINNFRELWKAAFQVKIWWPTSIVEQYLLGKNYRVLTANERILSVIRRYPPFVDGDGISSIDQLIDQENDKRNEMGLYPVIHPISKDQQIRHFLRKQRLTLNSVPGMKERVNLFNRISLAPGGVVETIDIASVPEVNRQLFLHILDLFQAKILGIDVIMEQGIETDYRQQKCIFLEVNSRPFVKMHDVPRYGEKQDLSLAFALLDKLVIERSDTY